MFRNKQFLLFLITGGFAALINLLSRIVFNSFFSFEESVVLAYIMGMVTAFILVKKYVFPNSKNSMLKKITYFILVNLLAVIQTYFISVFLVRVVFPFIYMGYYPKVIGHAIGIIFPIFTSFLGHKYLSFRSKDEK